MITFINDTDTYIVVYNNSKFSKQVPYKSKIQIDEEELNGDFDLRFKYNAFEESHTDIDISIKNEPIVHQHINIEHMTLFPMVTIVNVKDIKKVTLKPRDSLLTVLMFFKTSYLKGVECDFGWSEYRKQKRIFLNLSDKLRCLKLIKKELIITAPFVALLTLIFACGIAVQTDIYSILWPIIINLFVIGIWLSELHSYFSIKKTECENMDVDETSNS